MNDWGDFVSRYTSSSAMQSSPDGERDQEGMKLSVSPVQGLFGIPERRFCKRENVDQCIAFLNQVCTFASRDVARSSNVSCRIFTNFYDLTACTCCLWRDLEDHVPMSLGSLFDPYKLVLIYPVCWQIIFHGWIVSVYPRIFIVIHLLSWELYSLLITHRVVVFITVEKICWKNECSVYRSVAFSSRVEVTANCSIKVLKWQNVVFSRNRVFFPNKCEVSVVDLRRAKLLFSF